MRSASGYNQTNGIFAPLNEPTPSGRHSRLLASATWTSRHLLAHSLDGLMFAMQAVTAALGLFHALAGNGGSFWAVAALAAGLAAITVFRWALLRATVLVEYQEAYQDGLALRSGILRRLIGLPLGDFQSLRPGRLARVFGEDILWLENNASNVRPEIFFNSTALMTLLVSACFLAPVPGLSAIAFLGLGFALLFLVQRRLAGGFEARALGLEKAARALSEFGQGMAVLRGFGRARTSVPDFEHQVNRMRSGARKGVLFASPIAVTYRALADAASAGAIAVALAAASQNTLAQGADLGRLCACCLVLAAIVIPARNFASLTAMHVLARGARDNVSDLLATELMPHGTIGHRPSECPVEFRNVRVAYPGQTAPALDGISFEAPQGQLTALVGANGSGKTTCLQMLMRFRDVEEGAILVGGTDIRDLAPEALASLFAPVFQEPQLFHDTVAANIRLGQPDATEDEIMEAAKAAAIHDTIIARPGGYDAVVAPRGSDFSGGERQRLAIARAILKDAPIVLLDEATSALDPENEHLIQAGLRALTRDKTIVTVAHRLTTVMDADQIIVLDKGRIAASGRHDHLLNTSPDYQTLWKRFNAVRLDCENH